MNEAILPLASAGYGLTLGGWIIMVTSVGFVTGLLGWCMYRVMTESSSQKLHSQADIEPPDANKQE